MLNKVGEDIEPKYKKKILIDNILLFISFFFLFFLQKDYQIKYIKKRPYYTFLKHFIELFFPV